MHVVRLAYRAAEGAQELGPWNVEFLGFGGGGGKVSWALRSWKTVASFQNPCRLRYSE
jgi:hypothetical protein